VSSRGHFQETFRKSDHLSFCSYYRIFCPNFARVAEPFNAMLRKNVPVVPTAERLRAFEELKSDLTSAPALGIFRNEGEMVVDIDASSTSAAGAVCQQWLDGHLIVLEYASRCFSSAERNYCASRREFCGLIFALKRFRVYLLGRKFVCRVDNLVVSHVQSQKNPMAQLARCLDFLSDYDITFELRRGVANQNADALSRLRPCERGEFSEPCKQCRKRVTGKHVNIVQTRRQTRLQQDKSDEWILRDSQRGENFPATKPEALGRPSPQTQPISQVAYANHSTDVNDDQSYKGKL